MSEVIHFPYYAPELDRGADDSLINAAPYYEAASILSDARIPDMVSRGELTLAMIRPNVHDAILIDTADDASAADMIERQIHSLGVLAKFSVNLDQAAVEDFYGDQIRPRLQTREPQRDQTYANRWDEFVDLMTGGPVTALLLGGPDAIPTFRSQIGHRNVEVERDPATIRGKFAAGNFNNLVHGSDSPEAVLRELHVLRDCLLRRAGR